MQKKELVKVKNPTVKILSDLSKSMENSDWYQELVEECQAIITEAVFTSRWVLVEGYWKLGQRIREDDNVKKLKGDRYSKELTNLLQDLAVKVGKSEKTIFNALSVYDKYPELNLIPEGKNISMNKLLTKYLPETCINEKELDENLETKNHCPQCGYEW